MKSGEYKQKGEYHKNLDPNWVYLPIYKEKMRIIEHLLKGKNNCKILDVGCGEGILVVKYKEKDYDIEGVDLNYSSINVTKGNVLNLKFKDKSFDLILCLDVLEHLNFDEQEKALKEIHRILRDNELVIFAIPNLAHLISRLSFLFTGKLIRTSEIERHKGDRPVAEYLKLIQKYFCIEKRIGLFPTLPIISILTKNYPSKVLGLHQLYNRFLAYPNFCFENILVCRK